MGNKGEKTASDRGKPPREQEERQGVTSLPRPWQCLAAGGAKSCSVRANVLQRALRELVFVGCDTSSMRSILLQRYEK